MSMLKRISLAFLLLVLIVIGTLVGLLATRPGIHLLLTNIPRFVPGLEIAKIEGDWRDLQLNGVRFSMPGVDVEVGKFALGIDFSCLLNSRICVQNLGAEQVTVNIDSSLLPISPSTETPPLTDLITPYPIELRQLLLKQIAVTVDGTQIQLADFITAAEWQDRLVTLLPTTLDGLSIILPEAPITASKSTASPPIESEPLGKQLQALFAKPLLASLPEIVIPVDLEIQQFQAQRLQLPASLPVQIQGMTLQASVKDKIVKLDSFKINTAEGVAALSGQATLTKNWPVDLNLTGIVNQAPYKGERIKLKLSGELLSQLKLLLNLSGPVAAQLDVETSLSTVGLPLSVTFESKKIQWPLTGTSDYQAQDIRLRLTGKATDYVLSTRAAASGKEIPATKLFIDGKGNTQTFNLDRIRLNTLEGKVELSGVADWSKAISWNIQLLIDGINTTNQWPDWPAKLNGKMSSRGSMYGGNWELAIPEMDLYGSIKQFPLKVTGAVRSNKANQLRVTNLVAMIGKNQIEASGELSKQWNIDATIQAPDLAGIVPDLAGAVNGQIKLRGALNAPQVVTKLDVNKLRFADLLIDKISVEGDIRSDQQMAGSLNLLLTGLVQGDTVIKRLTLTAGGNEANHQMMLNMEGEPIAGQLRLDGHFDRKSQNWKGALSQTQLMTPVGPWKQADPVALQYQHKQQIVVIGAHCWLNPQAEICAPKPIEAGRNGQALLVLKRFDLTMFKALLGDTKVKGNFTGEVQANWKADGRLPTVKLQLVGDGVEVQQPIEGTPVLIGFDTLTINAGVNHQQATLVWQTKITQNGQFNGNVKVDDPQTERRLSGEIIIDALSLNLLKPVLVKGEKAEGALNGNLRLAGNVKRPQLFGRLGIDGLVLDAQWLPVTLKQSNIVMKFDGMRSTLAGNIQTDQGALTLSGDANWQNIEAWKAKVFAKGDKINVELPPMVKIDVSPDLKFEATPQQLTLTGNVAIPWARITVAEIPASAVGVSSDEVMLDNQLKPIVPKQKGMKIETNLAIVIGDDVVLDAFGLKASLKGNLKVTQNRHGLGVHGQISLPEGRFHAYGQDLLIKKGQLIFAGQAERPQLNIEAIRNPESTEDSVTVGIRVTGFADRPKLELFSDPAMSQEETLSYLLRGQGLDKSGGDGDMMTSALIGLGVASSGKLVGKIGETFGVQNLALDTEGIGDGSKVVVSGYVLPGLQVKYGMGIFDSLATLTLRYRLMPRLYLEAVSGLDQTLDLLYQFEF